MGVATRVSPPPDGLATGGFGLKPAVSEALDRTVAEDATRAAVGLGHAEVLEKVDEAVLDAPTTEHNTIVLVRVHLGEARVVHTRPVCASGLSGERARSARGVHNLYMIWT